MELCLLHPSKLKITNMMKTQITPIVIYGFWVSILLLSLTGCPADPICVKATNTRFDQLVLNFTQGRHCNRPTSINTVEFRSTRDNSVLWKITASDALEHQGKPLGTLIYGIVPGGFSGTVATKLSPGERIEVITDGIIYSSSTSGVQAYNLLTVEVTEK